MSTPLPLYDVLVIGGGIHGTGVAAEAASRKLKVLLCDKADLASGASSKTSSLISGGIQSLSTLELDVVKRSFNEQAILAKRAPHLVRHLDFSIPVASNKKQSNKSLFGKRSLQAGLLIYNALRPSKCNNKPRHCTIPNLLKEHYSDNLHYGDCSINDARLVISNALLARQLGAEINNYTQVHSAERDEEKQCWKVSLTATIESTSTTSHQTVLAKTLVNCSGKDTNQTLEQVLPSESRCTAQLLRGDHIVLPRLYSEHQGYLLQIANKQLIYVLPYRQKYTLVGSYEQALINTDTNSDNKYSNNELSDNAIEQLLGAINGYFTTQYSRQDIVRHFWSVRSAYDDTNENSNNASYDAVLDLECPNNTAPLINLFGGRLTTYRHTAEKTLELLKPYLHAPKSPSFKESLLPGGDIQNGNLEKFIEELQFSYSWLPHDYCERYARLYGSLCHQFLSDCRSLDGLGIKISHQLHEKEIGYLVNYEWARCAEDVLWRRTRMGMSFSAEQTDQLEKLIQKLL